MIDSATQARNVSQNTGRFSLLEFKSEEETFDDFESNKYPKIRKF